MADDMMAPGNGLRRMVLCAATGLLAGLSAAAAAQAMKDPTRPPPQFIDPAHAALVEAPPDSGVQTIRRSGKRREALVQGQWVRQGEMIGDAVVERIDENTVVLRHPDGFRETMTMYPDVEMRLKRSAGRTVGR